MLHHRGFALTRGVGGLLCLTGFLVLAYILFETRFFSVREQDLPAQRVQLLEVLLYAIAPLFFAGALLLILSRQERTVRSPGRALTCFGFGLVFLLVAVTMSLEAVGIVDWLRAGGLFLLGVFLLVVGRLALRGEESAEPPRT